jgi:hypothetical protein
VISHGHEEGIVERLETVDVHIGKRERRHRSRRKVDPIQR